MTGLFMRMISGVGIAAGMWLTAAADAALVPTLSAERESVLSGGEAMVWLNVLNIGTTPAEYVFPASLEARLSLEGRARISPRLGTNALARINTVMVPPGGFAREAYRIPLPSIREPWMELTFPGVGNTTLTFAVGEERAAPPATAGGDREMDEATVKAPDLMRFDPDGFFRRHFYGYEPIYFIFAPDHPAAKFQFSLRYRMFDFEAGEGTFWEPARDVVNDLYFSYTQTSLWDITAPSSPFYDTSYKPGAHFWRRNALRAPFDAAVKLDLQAGYEHESNGRNGANSRSLNLLYLQPTLRIGDPAKVEFQIGTRAWVHIMDLDDNPDIAEYRGHFDLRTRLTVRNKLQISALARVGEDWDQGSLLVDLSYPLFGAEQRGFNVFFFLQGFTGYGESLIDYDRRDQSLRAGFSLYR